MWAFRRARKRPEKARAVAINPGSKAFLALCLICDQESDPSEVEHCRCRSRSQELDFGGADVVNGWSPVRLGYNLNARERKIKRKPLAHCSCLLVRQSLASVMAQNQVDRLSMITFRPFLLALSLQTFNGFTDVNKGLREEIRDSCETCFWFELDSN